VHGVSSIATAIADGLNGGGFSRDGEKSDSNETKSAIIDETHEREVELGSNIEGIEKANETF